MRIEGRNLPDLGHGQAHLFGQRPQMRRALVTVRVLNQMEVLNQKVPPARTVA